MAKDYVGLYSNKAINGGDITLLLDAANLSGGSGNTVAQGAVIVVCGVTSSADGTPGFPGDWTEISNGLNSAGNRRLVVAYKAMGATPDTSVLFTGDGNADSSNLAAAFVWNSAVYDSTAGVAAATGSSTNPDPAALTPSQADSAIFAFAISTGADNIKNPSSGYTELFDGTTSSSTADVNDVWTYAEWLDGLAASEQNPGAIQNWGSGSWRVVTLALNNSSANATGTIAQTLPKLAQAATAIMHSAGSIAQNLPRLTQAASASERFSGSITQALPVLTQVASGTVGGVSGSIAQILPKLAQVISGSLGIPGNIAQILPKLQQSLTGTQSFTGSIAQILPKLAQSITAIMHSAGSITQVLPKLQQSLTALEVFTGSITQILPRLTQAASGTYVESTNGIISQILPPLTQAALGTMHAAGSITQILPRLTQLLSGTVVAIATCTLDVLLDDSTLTGVISDPVRRRSDRVTSKYVRAMTRRRGLVKIPR